MAPSELLCGISTLCLQVRCLVEEETHRFEAQLEQDKARDQLYLGHWVCPGLPNAWGYTGYV